MIEVQTIFGAAQVPMIAVRFPAADTATEIKMREAKALFDCHISSPGNEMDAWFDPDTKEVLPIPMVVNGIDSPVLVPSRVAVLQLDSCHAPSTQWEEGRKQALFWWKSLTVSERQLLSKKHKPSWPFEAVEASSHRKEVIWRAEGCPKSTELKDKQEGS